MPRLTLPKLISILLIISAIYYFCLQKTAKITVQVPNIVHFVLLKEESFNQVELDFISATCILAAYLHQIPQKIIIHSNFETISGKYWNISKSVIGNKLQLSQVNRPTHVFGYPLSSIHHSSDVIRLKILLEQGGIFLDLDTFLVKKLDEFFENEVTLGWPKGQNIGSQIILAKPNAYFIKLWLQSYKDYRASMWYYNAGEAPTKNILEQNPNLVHRVSELFGVQGLSQELYAQEKWGKWKEFYSIHLLARHRQYLVPEDFSQIQEFDEVNIQNYTKTFGEMAKSIWNHPNVTEYLV